MNPNKERKQSLAPSPMLAVSKFLFRHVNFLRVMYLGYSGKLFIVKSPLRVWASALKIKQRNSH